MITIGNVLYVRSASGEFVPVMGAGGGGTSVYIGATQPTDGTRYWLDTSDSGGEEEPEATVYRVTNNLTYVSNDNAATTATEGASYSASLTVADGYALQSVSVTMGGADITGTSYSGGNIYIASVTGDIVITATAAEQAEETTTYTITNTLINCTSSNSAVSVEENAAYSATITPNDGYTLTGATVSVTMGGADVTSTVYADGVITIAAVTGDVVISIQAANPNVGVFLLADLSVETSEGQDASGRAVTTCTRYKIEGIKTGDIVRLAGTSADNSHGWYDGTTYYELKDTSMFVATYKDNYTWREYAWTADQDYDFLWFASMTSKLDTYPNSAATIEKGAS